MSDIKIFVSHRIDMNTETFDNPLLFPIKSGAALEKRKLYEMTGDDTGDNISEKNPYFCELTMQYWAWKNVDADYYGLCHYRRFFSFADESFEEDSYGNISDKFINTESAEKYGLTEEKMRSVIEGYDIILPIKRDLKSFPEKYRSVRHQYASAPYLYEKDYDLMLEVIAEKYPEYTESAKDYSDGRDAYFCSLYVMKKDIFKAYNEWLFDILFEVERRMDVTHYTQESARTLGHLAERLLGIYITQLKKTCPELKIKELQVVQFFSPLRQEAVLTPAFKKENTVPVVLAANDKFVPMCSTTVQSLLENSNSERFYDITVLHTDITSYNQALMQLQVSRYPNVSLRFYNTAPITEKYKLKANEHISVETYYRFLIQDILPGYGKVLYIDCDLVVTRDVAELYDTDVSDYLLAAAYDPDFIGQVNSDRENLEYAQSTLKLEDPYAYFQAGVILFNTENLRSLYSMHDWLGFAKEPYRYCDQDVLNKHCKGKVKYLDMSWNVLTNCMGFRVPKVIAKAPLSIKAAYTEARNHPFIIHYAGSEKPWNSPTCDMSEIFWHYARRTPFYEKLLCSLTGAVTPYKKPKLTLKQKFVKFCKRITPKFMYPFAKKIKRLLRL